MFTVKPILMLLLIIPLSVFATDRKPPERPPVTNEQRREVHTQSGGGDNVEKYLLGAAVLAGLCYFFEWQPCRKEPENIFKNIKSEPAP